jgi:hypothetical protein
MHVCVQLSRVQELMVPADYRVEVPEEYSKLPQLQVRRRGRKPFTTTTPTELYTAQHKAPPARDGSLHPSHHRQEHTHVCVYMSSLHRGARRWRWC